MSKKSSSSRMRASCIADSTSASGVGDAVLREQRPSRASRRSRRSGSARRGPSPRGRSAGPCRGTLMLPGLIRRPWMPASSAAIAYFHWKWMSATTGRSTSRRSRRAPRRPPSAGPRPGRCRRPSATSEAICCSVALMSAVFVVVIDWTRDRRVAADRDAAELELPGLPPFGHRPTPVSQWRCLRLRTRGT